MNATGFSNDHLHRECLASAFESAKAKFGKVHGDETLSRICGQPAPSLQRQLQLRGALGERSVELAIRVWTQNAINLNAVPALKMLDRRDQRLLVDFRTSDLHVGAKIAGPLQLGCDLHHAGVRAVRVKVFLGTRNGITLAAPGHHQIILERLERAAIAGPGWRGLRQRCRNINRRHNLALEKSSGIKRRPLEPGLKVRGIETAVMHVRNVA